MTDFNLIIAIAGIAILLTGAYTIVVYKIATRDGQHTQVWNWWHRLASTVISVLLGGSVALTMFHLQQNRLRAQAISRACSVLQSELSSVCSAMSDTSRMTVNLGSTNAVGFVSALDETAIANAAITGLFPTNTTINLLTLVRLIRLYNIEVDHFLSLSRLSNADSGYAGRLTSAGDQLQRRSQQITSTAMFIAKQLDIPIDISLTLKH